MSILAERWRCITNVIRYFIVTLYWSCDERVTLTTVTWCSEILIELSCFVFIEIITKLFANHWVTVPRFYCKQRIFHQLAKLFVLCLYCIANICWYRTRFADFVENFYSTVKVNNVVLNEHYFLALYDKLVILSGACMRST